MMHKIDTFGFIINLYIHFLPKLVTFITTSSKHTLSYPFFQNKVLYLIYETAQTEII